MKLTKKRLKQIIKEELENLQEMPMPEEAIDFSKLSCEDIGKLERLGVPGAAEAWEECTQNQTRMTDDEGNMLQPGDPEWPEDGSPYVPPRGY